MNPTALPAMVRELDHHVGLVLAALKELNIEKETLAPNGIIAVLHKE
jgi:hypothetical protein